MKELYQCRFLEMAMSPEEVSMEEAMPFFDEFLIEASSLLNGSWDAAWRQYTKALFLLSTTKEGEKST